MTENIVMDQDIACTEWLGLNNDTKGAQVLPSQPECP